VIVEGGFNEDELAWFHGGLDAPTPVRLVAIDVSWDETRRRVDADPSPDRVMTRKVEVLKWHHDRFTASLPFLHENATVVDGEHGTPEDVALAVLDACELPLR